MPHHVAEYMNILTKWLYLPHFEVILKAINLINDTKINRANNAGPIYHLNHAWIFKVMHAISLEMPTMCASIYMLNKKDTEEYD